MSDIDTIKQEMDSTFYYINTTYEILKEEIKLFGWTDRIMHTWHHITNILLCEILSV